LGQVRPATPWRAGGGPRARRRGAGESLDAWKAAEILLRVEGDGDGEAGYNQWIWGISARRYREPPDLRKFERATPRCGLSSARRGLRRRKPRRRPSPASAPAVLDLSETEYVRAQRRTPRGREPAARSTRRAPPPRHVPRYVPRYVPW